MKKYLLLFVVACMSQSVLAERKPLTCLVVENSSPFDYCERERLESFKVTDRFDASGGIDSAAIMDPLFMVKKICEKKISVPDKHWNLLLINNKGEKGVLAGGLTKEDAELLKENSTLCAGGNAESVEFSRLCVINYKRDTECTSEKYETMRFFTGRAPIKYCEHNEIRKTHLLEMGSKSDDGITFSDSGSATQALLDLADDGVCDF